MIIEKCTISIYKTDFDYLDKIRETGIGKVSYADIVKKVLSVYMKVIE